MVEFVALPLPLSSTTHELTPTTRVLRTIYERRTVRVCVCEDLATHSLTVVKHARIPTAADEVREHGTTDKDHRVRVHRSSDAGPIELHMSKDDIEQECAVARLLQVAGGHVNIVQYIDVEATYDSDTISTKSDRRVVREALLTMEYCPNGDLFSLLEQQPDSRFDEAAALRFFREIACGLAHLHSLGVAHRDISLENVLLDDQWHARVGDFGLSTSIDVRKFDCVGKLHYMAPEVLAGQGYDPVQADIWSLGIVLFILLTGSPLFQLAVPSDPAWPAIEKIGISGVLTKWGLRGLVHDRTVALLTGMLRVDPERRLNSVDLVLKRLDSN